MARRGTRKSGNQRIVRRVQSPFSHFFEATGESVGTVAKTSGNIVKGAIKAVDRVGKSQATHTNRAISNVIRSRKSTRKNRRSSRKN